MNDAVFIAREHSVKRKSFISSALDFRIQNIFSDFWTKIFVLRVVNDFFTKILPWKVELHQLLTIHCESGQYGSSRSSDGLTVNIDYAMSQPDGKTETTKINHSERLRCSLVNPVDRPVNDKAEIKPDPNIKCKGDG